MSNPSSKGGSPPRVFVSYSQQDGRFLEEVCKQLTAAGAKVFTDQEIPIGAEWEHHIDAALGAAHVALLLVSANYLSSDFIRETELPSIFAVAEKGTLKVYWVLVSACTVPDSINKYQAAWREPALDRYTPPRRAEVWAQICRRLLSADLTAQPGRGSEDDDAREPLTELEELYEQRAEALERDEDTTQLDSQIVSIKRQNRVGGHLHAGDVLAERYKLREVLGTGGFATVWKAFDKRLGTMVAVKALHPQFSKDQTRRERFFRGARLMAELQHPGIVRVLERQLEDDGHYFFVMEYLPGGDLFRAVLEKPVSTEQAVRLVQRVGEALAYAHGRGVIHRDVKPANILLDRAGKPKLTDFDLVRGQDTTGGTRTGAMGTFVFAAPEQLDNAKTADQRADVFGLGMTLVFLFHGDKLPSVVLRDPESLVRGFDCSAMVRAAVSRAVAWKLGERWHSVAEFLEALAPKAEAAPSTPIPQSHVEVLEARQEPPLLQLEAGAVKEGPLGMRFRFIPAGTYAVGSPEAEPGRFEREWPRHEVRLTRGVWLAETPVTQAQWGQLVSANPARFRKQGEARPVERVSWFEAVAFANELSERAGLRLCYLLKGSQGDLGENFTCDAVEVLGPGRGGFRLPTEAEWEIAARAGTTSAVYAGALTLDEKGERAPELDTIAWYSGNSGGETRDVAQKQANAWGLHDMLGNAWEWCWDWWATSEPEQVRVDPRGPDMGSSRVIRGGSGSDTARGVRAAYRYWSPPGGRDNSLGFRLAQDQEEPAPEA